MEKMDIIGRAKLFYFFSGALLILSIAAFSFFGLNFGIDFTGGSIMELEFLSERPDVSVLQERVANWDGSTIIFTPSGMRGLLIRTQHLSDDAHKKILELISQNEPGIFTEKRFDSIGPTIGRELRRNSMLAIFLVIGLIVIYIAWAFRKVSKPVQSWKYGLVTVVTLLHDIILPAGLFAFLGRFYAVEVDTLFVTALLTIMGFSVHDTIVVFDRIRENLKSASKSHIFADIVNRSVNETMVRSINTSLTVILSLAAVLLFGGESVTFFSLALIFGIAFGTYSSIFIASPLLVSWEKFSANRGSKT